MDAGLQNALTLSREHVCVNVNVMGHRVPKTRYLLDQATAGLAAAASAALVSDALVTTGCK